MSVEGGGEGDADGGGGVDGGGVNGGGVDGGGAHVKLYEVRGLLPGAIGVLVVDAKSWKLTLVLAAFDIMVIVLQEASPVAWLAPSAAAAFSSDEYVDVSLHAPVPSAFWVGPTRGHVRFFCCPRCKIESELARQSRAPVIV